MIRDVRIFAAARALLAASCALLAIGCGPGSDEPPPDDADAGADVAVTDDAAQDDATPEADASTPKDASSPNPCPALTYPSGVKIQTFQNAKMTATYANHLASGEKAPKCFLDVDNLVDPDTGEVYPITVDVAAHFELEELVGTEVSQGYGSFVLATPAAVESLEKFRETLNTPVDVISGFRSPKHQEDVCQSLCGNPLGCSGTCANNSRHMFGDAFDLPLEFYTKADEQIACDVGFKFAYLESGTHLHVDQNPDYKTCVIE
ncbi:MAG TPA: hypothetical protein VGH28_27515 [Polyangiaceae bacterium]|jgi:hypothetical protein